MRSAANLRPEALSSLRALIFDFDGTLVDASEAICYSFNAVFEKLGHARVECAEIRRMIGRPLREMFASFFPHASHGDIERYVEEYRSVFRPVSVGLSRPLPGAREVIPKLAAQLSLAIVTSRAGAGARRILESIGLAQSFAVIVGIQDVLRAKPDPEPVLKAINQLGIEPAAAAMVGDTPDDILAARRAGVLAIGIASGAFSPEELAAAGADWVVDSLQELAESLG
jgi:phosphoglycolate phosphatase-like HAD superfamily hydrolase